MPDKTPYVNQYAHVMRQCGRFSPDDANERCGIVVYTPGRPQFSFVELPNVSNVWGEFVMTTTATHEALAKRPYSFLMGYLHTHLGRNPLDRLPSPQDVSEAARKPVAIHAVWFPFARTLTFYNGMGHTMTLHAQPKGIK